MEKGQDFLSIFGTVVFFYGAVEVPDILLPYAKI